MEMTIEFDNSELTHNSGFTSWG